MERNLAFEMVRVTEAAALSCARLMGRGDGVGADLAATDAMRRALGGLAVSGEIVVGHGAPDDGHALRPGERFGRAAAGDAPVEVALDPLEGRALCATGGAGALSVIAVAGRGAFPRIPDTYMEKIAVGPSARGAIDLTLPPAENLRRVAEAKRVWVEDLVVVILNRPRHERLVREVRQTGARIKLIGDGDVSAALATCFEESGVDVLMGTGGAPEGVLAAAALRCGGGDLQGRLEPRSAEEAERLRAAGFDLQRIWRLDDLAGGPDVMFAATGVTGGDLLRGVRYFAGGARTHSLLMRSRSGTIRLLETRHHFDRKPNYGW